MINSEIVSNKEIILGTFAPGILSSRFLQHLSRRLMSREVNPLRFDFDTVDEQLSTVLDNHGLCG